MAKSSSSCGGCLVLGLIGIFIIVVANSNSNREQAPSQPPPAKSNPPPVAAKPAEKEEPFKRDLSEPKAPSKPPMMAGSKFKLTSGYICTTAEAHTKLLDSVVAKDLAVFDELTATGDAFTVPTGTEVLIIRPGLIRCEVRVLDGTNRRGFVSPELLDR